MRGTYALMAFGAAASGGLLDDQPVRAWAALATGLTASAVLALSIARKGAGVAGQHAEHDRRSARVAEMTGIERSVAVAERRGVEFDPRLDLIAPAIAVIGLVAAGIDAGGNHTLAVVRTLVGAAFLGAITDAMLLGHWYLVQPGLARRYLIELVRWVTWLTPVEVAVMLVPTGMVSALRGTIDDGWGGLLGWMWVVCSVTTFGLCLVTRAALKERQYSAVMAATGLLYLAILTGFGTDLVARAVLAG